MITIHSGISHLQEERGNGTDTSDNTTHLQAASSTGDWIHSQYICIKSNVELRKGLLTLRVRGGARNSSAGRSSAGRRNGVSGTSGDSGSINAGSDGVSGGDDSKGAGVRSWAGGRSGSRRGGSVREGTGGDVSKMHMWSGSAKMGTYAVTVTVTSEEHEDSATTGAALYCATATAAKAATMAKNCILNVDLGLIGKIR